MYKSLIPLLLIIGSVSLVAQEGDLYYSVNPKDQYIIQLAAYKNVNSFNYNQHLFKKIEKYGNLAIVRDKKGGWIKILLFNKNNMPFSRDEAQNTIFKIKNTDKAFIKAYRTPYTGGAYIATTQNNDEVSITVKMNNSSSTSNRVQESSILKNIAPDKFSYSDREITRIANKKDFFSIQFQASSNTNTPKSQVLRSLGINDPVYAQQLTTYYNHNQNLYKYAYGRFESKKEAEEELNEIKRKFGYQNDKINGIYVIYLGPRINEDGRLERIEERTDKRYAIQLAAYSEKNYQKPDFLDKMYSELQEKYDLKKINLADVEENIKLSEKYIDGKKKYIAGVSFVEYSAAEKALNDLITTGKSKGTAMIGKLKIVEWNISIE